MSAARKEYKIVWIAKKRKELQLKRKLEAANIETSESDSNEEVVNKSDLVSSDVASCSHCEDEQCRSNLLSHSSSDESDDDRECWNTVEKACTIFSDSSDSGDELCNGSFRRDLQAWAVDCNVTHRNLDKLLLILQKIDKTLPSTAKTFLKQ